jgi:hypothetical protein
MKSCEQNKNRVPNLSGTPSLLIIQKLSLNPQNSDLTY